MTRCPAIVPMALAIAAALAGSAPAIAVDKGARAPACFTAADNRRLTFPVIIQAPPPRPHDSRYPFYPLSAAATMQVGTLAGMRDGIDGYAFHWANRSNAALTGDQGRVIVRKLNLQPSALGSRRQRTAFSDVARANACSMAQLHTLLGQPDAARNAAQNGAIALVRETEQPDAGAGGPDDACIVPAGALPPAARGVVLDYEVADGRSGDETRRFLVGYAAAVHAAGRRAILLTNPLNAPTQRFTGITAENAPVIARAFDQMTLMLWSGNVEQSLAESYRVQRALVDGAGPVDPARLIIDFELAGTTLADAALVHDIVTRDRLGGLMLWRNRARLDGDCASAVNRKIALATFGSDAAAGGQSPW